MRIQESKVARGSLRPRALYYAALVTPAILLAIGAGQATAGQLPISAFQTYNSATAAAIQPGPLALYSVPVDSLLPTQMNEGLTEVGKKAAGFDLLAPSQLQSNLLTDIEPVVVGPGGKLYLTDGHHTFTALENSIYGASDPTVYVNVIANYSNLTTAEFFAMMQAQNLLLPLNDGVAETVNTATGAPIPTSLTGLNSDVYRGLEYSILKNKSSVLFTSAANITGAVGASTPGLDKMTGLYSDFLEAAAYRNAKGGLGLPYLSPGDIALATQWNLNAKSVTSLPNVAGAVTAAQLPGFILSANIVNSGGISNATLADGAMDGNGGFTGITQINAGTATAPIMIGTPNTGFIMELGDDAGHTVTLNGINTYTGGTSILAGTLIVASDASLGAASPAGATINPNSVLQSVQSANGIVFNSLTEGNGTLQIGTAAGNGTSTFTLDRPIAVDGEAATINVNGYVVSLTGEIASLGTIGVGIGNATGYSDLTIDDLNSGTQGKLILSGSNPYFYGNLIIGATGTPTVEVMSDAALGNTTGPAASIGEVELNGGTFQAGANITALERDFFLGGGSTFDVNGFTTSWGSLTDVQRTLVVTNSNATTAGAVTFSSLNIGATAALQLTGGAAGETVTFTNGIDRTGNDTLILSPSSATTLGSKEKVFSGTGAASLVNGIAPAWIVTNNGVSKNAGPYDFVTYGANGYVKATYSATTLGTASGQVVALAANATPTGNVDAFALNTEGKTITLGASNSLTIGDGVNPAGLILASGSAIKNGTLAFGASEGVVWLSGANATISSEITGANGLTFAGSGAVALSTAANVSGPITVDSGTVTLAGVNIFASDVDGVLLDDTKSKPAPATLAVTANNMLTALNTVGNNSAVTLSNGAALTLGDTVNNLSSTISSTVTQTGTAVAGALTLNGSGLFDFSGGSKNALALVAGSSIIVDNSAQFRVVANEFANSNISVVLNGSSQLQFAQNDGGVFANTVSGTGALHLIGGILQITGTNNTYSGGTIVETGSTLDITTANLPAINPNIVNAGGLVVFDQATSGTYNGVISDGAEMGTGPVLSGSLDKDDSSGANGGNVTLAKAQTFTGATTIEAGTLTLAAVDTLATSSGVDLGRVGGSSVATLALGADNTIQALTSEADNSTFVTLGAHMLTINTAAATDANFGGVISGSGAVVKKGAGTQIFAGADAYSGGTIVQAGALIVTGSINSTGATTVSGGVLDVAKNGSLVTSATNVNGGVLELDSGSTFDSATLNVAAGGTVDAAGGSISLAGATYNNSGVLNLQNGSASNVLTLGAYNGAAGSQIDVGVNFGTGSADKLVVTSVTGGSQIVVTDVAPNTPGVYNPAGIPIVVSTNPMSATSFTLAGSPIQKGLFQYDLVYDADPEFLLVGVPSADAYRLATLPTAAQSIWQDTAGVWLDRQADLRDLLSAGAPPSAPQGDARAAATPPMTEGVWARAIGDWANRSETQTYSLLSKTYSYQTGYSQNTGAFFGGVDGAMEHLLNRDDTLLMGVTGGYINSTQSFKGSSATATYQGGSVGVSATYLNQNFFVDTLLKADFLNLNFSDSALSGYGANQQKANVANYGAIIDAGYRFSFNRTTFVEPLATLAYVSSHIGGLTLAGSQIGFGDNDILRGRLGLRGGSMLFENADFRIDGSASASYWARLSGSAMATINSGVGAPLLTISDKQVAGYGELGLGLNIASQTSGWSGFVKGDYEFASGFNAGSIKGGVSYKF
ncbi:ParB-like protein [Methylocapsa sp. S129]|uniref:ParB-like protein n=1 Tax=Methylocapsa sp. S129 TaxID=1641869 RepID=UPI00131B1FA9|nr:ParB-like protein [Methylocapsa sp. S129]